MMRLRGAVLMTLLAAATAPLAAQGGPSVVQIAPSDSVRLLQQRVFERGPAVRVPGKRLDVVYSSWIPAANAAERLAQARRAAAYFGAAATRVGAHRLSIGICDTQACRDGRHPPSEWHLFERTASGWRLIDPRTIH